MIVCRIIASEINVEQIVFCETHKGATKVLSVIVDDHRKPTHWISETRWNFQWKSFWKIPSQLHSFRRQHFHVYLVADFIFVVPRVENSSNYCGDIVLRFTNYIVANILPDILKDSRVSTTVVFCCTRSRMKTCDISQISIPTKHWHSCRWGISRNFPTSKFVSELVVQFQNQLFVHRWQQNNLSIFPTVLCKLLLVFSLFIVKAFFVSPFFFSPNNDRMPCALIRRRTKLDHNNFPRLIELC